MARSQETLRNTLADFIHRTSLKDIPDEAIRHTKHCILDLIGVSIPGGQQNSAAVVREIITESGGNWGIRIWGFDQKLPLLPATMLNALQGHAIDMDDGHRFANGHPGVVTIPPAFALAERENLSGRNLIEAVATGYDIFIRLGSVINPDLLLRGFHTTATIGTFASAAVSSKLLGLGTPQIENALALAGLQSAGLLEALSSGEMGKSFQVAKAAQNGVQSALMAQKGVDGPTLVFEGEKGFFKAFAGKTCDTEAVCRKLGTDFHVTGTYFKKHAACRHIHSAVDAIAEVVSRESLAVDEIESIDVETYTIARNLTGHMVSRESELAAKFSMPISIGLIVVFGHLDATAFKKHFISDPRVLAIANKVSVRVNPENDTVYPKQRPARVTINTKTKAYTHEVVYPKGEPENPLLDEELVDKYRNNVEVLYSPAQANRIKDMILNMENIKVRELAEMLGAPQSV